MKTLSLQETQMLLSNIAVLNKGQQQLKTVVLGFPADHPFRVKAEALIDEISDSQHFEVQVDENAINQTHKLFHRLMGLSAQQRVHAFINAEQL
jgi:hypothetical protein